MAKERLLENYEIIKNLDEINFLEKNTKIRLSNIELEEGPRRGSSLFIDSEVFENLIIPRVARPSKNEESREIPKTPKKNDLDDIRVDRIRVRLGSILAKSLKKSGTIEPEREENEEIREDTPLGPSAVELEADIEERVIAERTRRLEEIQGFFMRACQNQEYRDAIQSGKDAIVYPESGRRFPALGELGGFVVGAMRNKELRSELLDAIDEAVRIRSERLKSRLDKRDGGSFDVVIIGTGPHGTAFASALQYIAPDLKVLAIDEGERIGGGFRRYGQGKRAVFDLNSRGHRKDNTSVQPLPGGDGNLNPLGRFATVQLPQFSYGAYPTNDEIAAATAVNSFLAVDAITGVKVSETYEDYESGRKINLEVKDIKTGQEWNIRAGAVISAGGISQVDFGNVRLEKSPSLFPNNRLRKEDLEEKFEAIKTASASGDKQELERALKELPRVLHADWLLQLMGDPNIDDLYKKFIGKKIAFVGGGDSFLVCAEWFARLAPKEAYGSVPCQAGLPESITAYGCLYRQNGLRNRYARLSDFITTPSDFRLNEATFIRTNTARVSSVVMLEDRAQVSTGFGSSSVDFDYVIFSTGVKPDTFEYERFDLEDVDFGRNTSLGTTVARKVRQEDIYFVGPTASIPVSSQERAKIPAIREFGGAESKNVVALWRTIPRTDAAAMAIGKKLRERK